MRERDSLSVKKLFGNIFFLHSGPVLSVAITASGEQCFSGGIDSTIQWWNIPSSSVDPYDTYGEDMYWTLFDFLLLSFCENSCLYYRHSCMPNIWALLVK